MEIDDFRPTKADIELLLVSPESAPLTVSQLMRRRAREEWRVPDMPPVRNGNGEEFTDRQWGRTIGAWATNTLGASSRPPPPSFSPRP